MITRSTVFEVINSIILIAVGVSFCALWHTLSGPAADHHAADTAFHDGVMVGALVQNETNIFDFKNKDSWDKILFDRAYALDTHPRPKSGGK
jgi:hypothetical protein